MNMWRVRILVVEFKVKGRRVGRVFVSLSSVGSTSGPVKHARKVEGIFGDDSEDCGGGQLCRVGQGGRKRGFWTRFVFGGFGVMSLYRRKLGWSGSDYGGIRTTWGIERRCRRGNRVLGRGNGRM